MCVAVLWQLGYAGTKDKRACTTQWCTVYRRRAEELASLNRFFNDSAARADERGMHRGRQLLVGNFSYVSHAHSYKFNTPTNVPAVPRTGAPTLA